MHTSYGGRPCIPATHDSFIAPDSQLSPSLLLGFFLYTVAIVPRRITTSSGRSNDFPYRYAVPKVIDYPRYEM